MNSLPEKHVLEKEEGKNDSLNTLIRGHSIITWTRWGREAKNVWFALSQGIKTDHAGGGGGQKMAKFCQRNCWMTPKTEIKTSHEIS